MKAKDEMHRKKTGRQIMYSVLTGAATCGILLASLMIGTAMATHDSKPVAVIDGTLKVAVGETVYLDGTFSSDPGGGTLSFLWTFEALPEGSISSITDLTDAHAKFVADVPGIYRVRLVVNNGFVDSDPAFAIVIVHR